MSPDEKIDLIISAISEKRSLIIAFSGGVDSSVISALAFKALGKNAVAVTANSQTLAPGELENAKSVAGEIGIQHMIISYDELDEPDFKKNPVDRCYHCKKGLLRELKKVAEELKIKTIADGTNFSDLNDHRPGYRALVEEGIYNPFIDFKVTKDEIRQIARILCLSVSEKPSMACLSSRFPYGYPITPEGLKRVGESEKYLRELGFEVIRVRDHSGIARIEVMQDEILRLTQMRDIISDKLKKLGFSYVTLDLAGFRSGSMDEVLDLKPSQYLMNHMSDI